MIKLSNLTRRYGNLLAVDDVSFTIKRGEVVGLLGHNGAGKTTIMKMLTGFLEPTAGSIEVDDLAIGRDTAAIQRRIGYLPENCPVWPEMAVSEFLEYQAALHDVPAAGRGRAIAEAIRRTDLQDKATQSIQTLSRGYRQRVGVAQAILHRPDIVILDEPTNGLDPTQILHMRSLIVELAKSATVIISTHILQEVQAVCERVLILRGGRKIIDSRLDDLQRDARLLVTIDRGEEAARPVLAAVAGVRSVALLDSTGGRYRYALDAGAECAPAVAAAAQAASFGLHELVRRQRTLEAVFAEVNSAPHTEVRDAA
ncbi:MAG TPA: ABC transporter ATP-binding protein [Steroidobacteraceae bacterium]|nr:ABC transporter ATP-binding protein [Steroidobacteraceae bacterium]